MKSLPSNHLHLNPMIVKPEKAREELRVIVVLYWPEGDFVNTSIHVNSFPRKIYKMGLGTVDMAVSMDIEMARAVWLAKKGRGRAYRQLKVDLLNWSFLACTGKAIIM